MFDSNAFSQDSFSELSWSFVFIPYDAPPILIYTIPAEDRTFTISSEDRLITMGVI